MKTPEQKAELEKNLDAAWAEVRALLVADELYIADYETLQIETVRPTEATVGLFAGSVFSSVHYTQPCRCSDFRSPPCVNKETVKEQLRKLYQERFAAIEAL